MLTLGHGQSAGPATPQAAAAAAEAPKRPFGAVAGDAAAGELAAAARDAAGAAPADARRRARAGVADHRGPRRAGPRTSATAAPALTVGQLAIDEAIVWPQQGRILEAWATRLREAREAFVDDPPLRALVESAAADYLSALADPHTWTDEAWRHHFQPAWAGGDRRPRAVPRPPGRDADLPRIPRVAGVRTRRRDDLHARRATRRPVPRLICPTRTLGSGAWRSPGAPPCPTRQCWR